MTKPAFYHCLHRECNERYKDISKHADLHFHNILSYACKGAGCRLCAREQLKKVGQPKTDGKYRFRVSRAPLQLR